MRQVFSLVYRFFVAFWKESCYDAPSKKLIVEMTPFTPPPIELLNQLLPAYHFLDFIAQGGMGAVYLAKQVSLDREVAVKILPMELTADPEFSASFKTEARAMAKLNHPNLIAIYDFGEINGMLFIAMEYVPGKSLYHSSWNKQIDPVEAGRIVMGICDGLSHAHDSGIIHRDIKPANILLTPKIAPKIGDFGLAQSVGVKHDGLVMGTPGYSAPEVISNPEKADRRSDIFAVGVILHELLTGHLPEPGHAASDLVNCSREFDKIIQRATHPNPLMRYPDAHSMASAIGDALKSPYASPGAALKNTRAMPARPVMPRPASPVLAKNAPPSGPSTAAFAARSPAMVIDNHETARSAGAAIASMAIPKRAPQRNLIVLAALVLLLVGAYQGVKIYAAKKASNLEKPPTVQVKMPQSGQIQPNSSETPQNELPTNSLPDMRPGESSMDSLARLRDDLKNGKRDQMPVGAERRGELDFLLVAEPMTWNAALAFAENHGAHIAQPQDDASITFLKSLLNHNEVIWLGVGRGGKDQWVMLDGSTWTKIPSGIGAYATLSPLGTLRATEGNKKNAFVLAWHRNGTSPYSLAAMLHRTRQSLTTKSPVYPPGTRSLERTSFLPVLRPMIRAEALNLAELAGAHIATISNEEKGGWLLRYMADFECPRGIWLGAEKSGTAWQWNTKETWGFTQWAVGAPSAEQEATALVYLPKKGWQNVDKGAIADGVLLEWNDVVVEPPKQTERTEPAPPQEVAADVQPLIAKARDLVLAAVKERDEKLSANTRAFVWDLDVWLRGLKGLEREKWLDVTEKIKALAGDGRVPSAEEITEILTEEGRRNRRKPIKLEDGKFKEFNIVVRPIHEGIAKIQNYSYNKQKVVDTDFLQRSGKVRDFFIAKINEIAESAKKNNQPEVVGLMSEFQSAARNLDDWVSAISKK